MLIDLNEVKNHIFSFSGINVLLQYPVYHQLSLLKAGRGCNGFLYIKEGKCKFSFKEGSFTAEKGSIVYLPFNSRHKLLSKSEKLAFYRIDFNLHIDNELAYFSTHPIKISDSTSHECYSAIKALCNELHLQQDNIFKTEKMCTIFKSLQDINSNENYKRLAPAINYITEHLTETLDCHFMLHPAGCQMVLSQRSGQPWPGQPGHRSGAYPPGGEHGSGQPGIPGSSGPDGTRRCRLSAECGKLPGLHHAGRSLHQYVPVLFV